MSSHDPSRLAPGDLVDDFEIEAVIAEGGSSTTYRATSRALDRPVSLKLFHSATFTGDAAAIEAARTDASAVARLEHPGIVPVFAAGDHEGGLYVASALGAGSTLAELAFAGDLTPTQVVAYIGEAAAALEYAHGKGVLHRDLRPDCITIGRWGHALVRDFGVTRTSGRTGLLTRAEVMESLRYTAPEIVLGRAPSPKSDTYGLAAVAVWALTGAPPYRDRPAAEYVMFRTSAPPPLLTLADGTPAPELSAALHDAMAVDPADRPAPARFAAALATAVQALPAAAREAGTPLVAKELAAPAAAPARAPSLGDVTRVEHRRPVPTAAAGGASRTPWTTYAACVAAALTVGLVGLAAGRLTAEGPPPQIAVGRFTLTPQPPWTITGRVPEGPAPTGEPAGAALRGTRGETAEVGIASGRLPGDPLPAAHFEGTAPRPRAAASGATPLVVYRTPSRIAVVRTTTVGALYADCSAAVGQSRCAALVVGATGDAGTVRVLPDPRVSDALREAMTSVQQATGVALSEMEGDRKARAGAADRLANALREAAGQLAVDGVDPATAAALTRTAQALAREGVALEDLSGAFDRRSAPAEKVARTAATAADRALRTSLASFRRAGYRVSD